MGLDLSHDAFSGSYPAFNRLRQCLCEAAGGSFPPHADPTLDPTQWYLPEARWDTSPGLLAFLAHSDCDGEMDPPTCRALADELEALLPVMQAQARIATGHLARDGGYVAVVERLIRGCRRAVLANEALRFE